VNHPPTHCVCCGSDTTFAAISTTAYADIWAALERELGLHPTAALHDALTPATHTTLWQCTVCTHQIFSPCVSGTDAFYEALTNTQRYYGALKWEFGWVRERVGDGRSVLDVGCGPGDFLAVYGKNLGRGVGLELNPAAATQAKAQGVEVHMQTVEDFGTREGRVFDAACSFHVLEHVERPDEFAKAMARCVKSGGRLYLSVPNRDRIYKEGIEPLDHPPHHLSRWNVTALRNFGTHIGCPLTSFAFEPARVETVRYVVEKRVARSAGVVAGWIAARALCPPGINHVWKATNLYDRFKLHGMSVVAEYTVP
jgi:SAM-dependent methyltransferase